jgi:hypothetical protein
MKSVLFGVDSLFQFIIATNLRTTVYKDDEADIIIYSSTPPAKGLYEKVSKKSIYRNVYYADSSLCRCGKNYTFKEKIPKYFVYLLSMPFPKKTIKRIIGCALTEKYDEFVFHGFGALADCIFNVCYRNNTEIVCKRIEDAYVSYFTLWGSKKNSIRRSLESLSNTFLGNKNIENHINGYYFSEPEMVMAKIPYPIIQAPKFGRANKPFVELLNDLFDYKEVLKTDKKIFLFEDGRLFFDGSEEEVELVKDMISYIPKEKIAIKMHPRRKVDRFASLGVESMKASKVPWEVIQLNQDYSGCILMTVSSSAVFSSDIYFGDKCYKILLYKCLKNPLSSIDAKFEAYVQKYKERFGSDYLFIPESYDELKHILLKIS